MDTWQFRPPGKRLFLSIRQICCFLSIARTYQDLTGLGIRYWYLYQGFGWFQSIGMWLSAIGADWWFVGESTGFRPSNIFQIPHLRITSEAQSGIIPIYDNFPDHHVTQPLGTKNTTWTIIYSPQYWNWKSFWNNLGTLGYFILWPLAFVCPQTKHNIKLITKCSPPSSIISICLLTS